MVICNIHFSYILYKLALFEQLADYAYREITGGGIGISSDIIGDQYTTAKVLDDGLNTTGSGRDNQVGDRTGSRFPT